MAARMEAFLMFLWAAEFSTDSSYILHFDEFFIKKEIPNIFAKYE